MVLAYNLPQVTHRSQLTHKRMVPENTQDHRRAAGRHRTKPTGSRLVEAVDTYGLDVVVQEKEHSDNNHRYYQRPPGRDQTL